MQLGLLPFFCYYGGKWRIAPYYPVPEYPTIIEPFAGAAGYATRYPSRQVYLFDKDPVIAGLWQYLIQVKESEIYSLPLKVDHVDNLIGACQEVRWLIGFWLNRGTNSPRLQPSVWMKSGTCPHRHWGEAIRHRLASQVQHIRHWRVSLSSYEQSGDWEATWFIDPPYDGVPGRRYRHHDVDYSALSKWCQARSGQVMVCEVQGAAWLPFQSFRRVRTRRGKFGKGCSDEVMWTNTSQDVQRHTRRLTQGMFAWEPQVAEPEAVPM